MAKKAYQGSCLCGAVGYEVQAESIRATHCHCSMCRKAHGAAYATWGDVPAANFRWTQGEDLLIENKSSQELSRFFCSRCGAQLAGVNKTTPEVFNFTIGTLEDGAPVELANHIFVGFKAPWHKITDSLPQLQEYE